MLASYRARLMLALAGMMLAGQMIAALLFLTRLPALIGEIRLDELRDQTTLLAGQFFPTGVPDTLDAATQQRLGDAARLLRGGILVSDPTGAVLHAAGDVDLPTKMAALGMLSRARTQDRVALSGVSGGATRRVLLGTRLLTTDGREGVMIVAVPVGTLRQPAMALLPAVATSLGLALVLSLAVAFVLGQTVAAPVHELTVATEAVARGDYSHQVGVAADDELGRLAARFNAMIREVGRSRQTLRDFTINVSHDLKTPVSIIQGFAEALVDGVAATPAQQAAAARAIQREAGQMARMIGELLDLARLESGQMALAREQVDVAEMCHALAARYGPMVEATGARLVVDVAGRLPVVLGDVGYLERATSNLLDNALAHSPPGGQMCLKAYAVETGRTQEMRLAPALPPGLWVVISVTDNGPGVEAGDLDRLFERFHQADKARSRSRGGTGLGLAIVREIATQHGGHVAAWSEPGHGSEFAIALPPSGRP